ncbi:hypothetical protein NBRC110019_28680 [Neptunitalea chrysea]|uniref:STAS/SEC14 domain-containing protein n=1 Tax=Neptunitalea chrysea TaxID=1647581 RepID=A0A9W6EWF8_9FLAO|nr:hypothetical protein [Neptunitalea chrysea]GLB53827.1 hypothetical protein NBRC110019_28680 [Neptunitalea chrysea]
MLKARLGNDFCGAFHDKYETDMGTFYFFEKYVITEFNEGVTVNFENCKELCFLIDKFYGENKSFGVISNRVYSYSVFPTDYLILRKMHLNLKCIAVVNYKKNDLLSFESEQIEKIVCPRPFQSFTNIKDARKWLYSIVY